jgi:cytochrome b6-f complex iron-sulfur subunit
MMRISDLEKCRCRLLSISMQINHSKIMLKRRSFLTYFGLGCFASCFPVVLAACAPKSAAPGADGNSAQEPAAKTDAPGAGDKGGAKKAAVPLAKTADGFSIVGTVADLDQTGQLQVAQVAVSRDAADPKKLLAVNPKCTHKGCTVNWDAAGKKYECPCHDSNFAADGKVLKGPAAESLATYPVKIVGKQVLVKI